MLTTPRRKRKETTRWAKLVQRRQSVFQNQGVQHSLYLFLELSKQISTALTRADNTTMAPSQKKRSQQAASAAAKAPRNGVSK